MKGEGGGVGVFGGVLNLSINGIKEFIFITIIIYTRAYDLKGP